MTSDLTKVLLSPVISPWMHPGKLFIQERELAVALEHVVHFFETPVCRLDLEEPGRDCGGEADRGEDDVELPADLVKSGGNVESEPEVDEPVVCQRIV